VVAGELRTEPARLASETARLEALALTGSVEEMNRQLATALRRNELSPPQLEAVLEHLLATARETLEVTNPRFELALDL
jgi:hypothetical protein